MKNIDEYSNHLLTALFSYFKAQVKTSHVRGINNTTEAMVIQTPFLYYDNSNIQIWITKDSNGYFIHDNSWIFNYLNDYGIKPFANQKNKSKKLKDFSAYCNDLAEKYKFQFDSTTKRLILRTNPQKEGEEIFKFIDGLLAISFLVLRQDVGLKQLTIRDIAIFNGIRESIKQNIENIEVIPHIPLDKIGWKETWGSLIRNPSSNNKMVLQYIGGATLDKILTNVMVSRGVFQLSQNWLDIPRENCIIVYGGSSEFYKTHIDKIKLALNGSGKKPYQVVTVNETAKLMNIIDQKLGMKMQKYLTKTNTNDCMTRKEKKYQGPNFEKIDPFEITPEMVSENEDKVRVLLLNKVTDRYKKWIQSKFVETGAESMIVCNKKVVFSSRDRYAPWKKDIKQIERNHGRICYIFTREERPIEDLCAWNPLRKDDCYPTLDVYIGDDSWDDEKMAANSVHIICDFDTGNPDKFVTDDQLLGNINKIGIVPAKDIHLGAEYIYFLRYAKIGIMSHGRNGYLEKTIEGVVGWDDLKNNPFLRANPKRKGFVGRDIMHKLFLEITLDPKDKKTKYKFLNK